MSSVIEHCDAQCDKCAIGCLSAVAVAATDETAEWAARSANPLRSSSMGLLPRESLPIPTRPFAPGVIDGPYTADAQAHHEWEDLERVASDGWKAVRPWVKATALACLLAAVAGYYLPDWTAVARLFSRLR